MRSREAVARDVAWTLARRARLAWTLPVGVAAWRLLKWLRSRRGRSAAGPAQSSDGQDEDTLEAQLLPPSDRVWDMYDEEAVEGLWQAAEDPWEMASRMRE